MDRDKIIFFRNFFFAAFIIGLIFALFYFGVTLLFWKTGESWATHFFKIDEKEFGRLVLLFFIQLRVVLIFFFRVPARWRCTGWCGKGNPAGAHAPYAQRLLFAPIAGKAS